MLSYYIRSEKGFCLVKLPGLVSLLTPYEQHMAAVQEAEEQGICPAGTRIIQCVVEQEEYWYGKLFTDDEAKMLKNDSRIK